MPGEIYLQIEFPDPRRPTARLAYGGIEIRGGKIRVPFATKSSAQLAMETMIAGVVEEHPFIVGTVLPDPDAIIGNDKGDGNDSDLKFGNEPVGPLP